jgi:hypothetical protein
MTSFPLEAAVVRPANNELVATWSFASNSSFRDIQPVRLAYQPPVSSTFLSNKLTNNNQSPVPLFNNQPPAKRTNQHQQSATSQTNKPKLFQYLETIGIR